MLASSPFHRRSSSRRVSLSAVIVILGASFMGGVSVLMAAEAGPILIVPAADVTLHVAVPLPEGESVASADAWQLVEADAPDAAVAAELVPALARDGSAADSGQLLAAVPPRQGATGPRRFLLRRSQESGKQAEEPFRFVRLSDASVKLLDGQSPVLVYNHGVITCDRVPENDHRRRRGCYIHPVWGLNGEMLTDDFPRDHYHHHGIFWTWPHIGVDGEEYDLWAGDNIEDKFVQWICGKAGAVAAMGAVENGWYVGDRKVMIERVWLRTYKACEDARVLDLEFTWIPVGSPVTLLGAGGKSYGGLTVRFAVQDSKKTVITVPSGRTTQDLPDTPLKWADLSYPFQGTAAPSGAAVFIHSGHPDYPPTWLTRHYGPLCVGWPGVKPKTFEPGNPIRLCYRVWIHKAAVGLDELSQAYQAYVAATEVKWQKAD